MRHAHSYWARVYVTVNTLLYDHEPPLPLIASTQMHNHTPERVAFLEAIGFRRVILARELSLDQIRAIAPAPPWSSSISSTGRCVFPTTRHRLCRVPVGSFRHKARFSLVES